MTSSIVGPFDSVGGLDDLRPLWGELHLHHLRVATYGPLVHDVESSWVRRRAWYARLLADGGVYLLARDTNGTAVGYAFIQIVDGADDTFEAATGIAEVVSLVVTADERHQGVGRSLLSAVDALAKSRGIDTLKVAVMAGNDAAVTFYAAAGFTPAELVLYRYHIG